MVNKLQSASKLTSDILLVMVLLSPLKPLADPDPVKKRKKTLNLSGKHKGNCTAMHRRTWLILGDDRIHTERSFRALYIEKGASCPI